MEGTPSDLVVLDPGKGGQGGGGRGSGGSGGGYSPPSSEGGGGAPSMLVVRPANEVKPPGGRDFNQRGFATGLNIASTAIPGGFVLPGSAFTIPRNTFGMIRSITLAVNTLLLTSNLTWSLRFNGSPVVGWEALQVIPGPVAYFSFSWGPEETTIWVPEAATIDVQFLVGDAATYSAGVQYHGWFFPKKFQERMEEAYR